MDSKRLLSQALTALALVFVLASCSNNNQQAFHKRKYQPWFVKSHSNVKHHQSVAKVEKREQLKPAPVAVLERVSENKSNKQELVSATNQETFVAPTVSKKETVKALKQAAKEAKQSEKQKVSVEDVVAAFKQSQSIGDNELGADDTSDILLVLLLILAVILPPLAVLLVRGFSLSFVLSILLTIFFWLPGIIYALYVVFKDNY